MPFSLLRLGVIAALFAGACSGSTANSDNSPGNLSITPNVGYSSAEVATVITGTGFLAKARVPQGGGEPTLDTKHRAWIGDHELTGVTWQSTTKLDATVPADVPSGTYDLIVENAIGNRGTVKGAYAVRDTPPFSATAMVDHPSVSVGQVLTLIVSIANRGNGEVTSFALGAPVVSSSDGGAASPGAVPSDVPSRLAAGEERNFVWTYTPSHAGNISIAASATGVDSLTGKDMTAELAAPVAVVISSSAALTAALTPSSPTPAAGQAVTMTLLLANAAGGGATDVTAVTPSMTPTDGISCTAAAASAGAVPSATAPIRIAGGATETFTWTCTGSAAGSYTLSAAVTATDVNAGASIATNVTGVVVTYGASHARADMSATVSMSDVGAPVGEYVTGTATCTNGGPDVATNPTCSVTGLPVGATLDCTPAPLPATLERGAAVTCSMYYAMPAAAVTVTVTAGSATEDRTPANNTDSATTSLTPFFLQPLGYRDDAY
jgi:hypothetical protein